MTRIRPAAESDRSALDALIERSARKLSASYYDARQIERAITHIFGVDSQLLLDGTMYVAEIDGDIAGCGGWSRRNTLYGGDRVASRNDRELDPVIAAARIRAFFVDPRHARKGVARTLLAACEEAAHAYGFRQAELVATLPGVPFYSALGYSEAGSVEIDMGDGVMLSCVRMVKALSGF